MQRILSLENSRSANGANTASEFVSKRFCFSILFSIAFLFLLAGYLLGRYTTDRAIILKKALLQQKYALEEKNAVEVMKNISTSVRSINNLTLVDQLDLHNSKEVYDKMACADNKTFLPDYSEFKKDVSLKINKILSLHLERLASCFSSIDDFLKNISSSTNN